MIGERRASFQAFVSLEPTEVRPEGGIDLHALAARLDGFSSADIVGLVGRITDGLRRVRVRGAAHAADAEREGAGTD